MRDTEHRVQGLNNDEVPADWPALGIDEVTWLARRYPQLHGHGDILWHSPRPLSAAALVHTSQGPVFIKRHHRSVRNATTLNEEHHFITHLAHEGLPVAALLRDRGGDTVAERGQWTYELFKQGAGTDLYRDIPSWSPITERHHAMAAGRTLAQLHRAAADYHGEQRSTHLLVARDDLLRAPDPISALQASLAQRPALADYLADKPWQQDLRETISPWHARLHPRLDDEPALWAHNDWHASNLLWSSTDAHATVSTIFDFGLASPTSALYDLATAIERNAVAWLSLEQGTDAVHADIAVALLEGYRQHSPLSADRVHLMADLLPVVHLDFALSEVEYFHGITRSRRNADTAYYDFLLGHARWFHTAHGQHLLAALHAAA